MEQLHFPFYERPSKSNEFDNLGRVYLARKRALGLGFLGVKPEFAAKGEPVLSLENFEQLGVISGSFALYNGQGKIARIEQRTPEQIAQLAIRMKAQVVVPVDYPFGDRVANDGEIYTCYSILPERKEVLQKLMREIEPWQRIL